MSDLVASIDLGTNSVLLTIASAGTTEGELGEVIEQRATVTRLGQAVDETGRLHPDAQARTLACLKDYRSILDIYGVRRAAAVGTSALRDAQGGQSFVEQASQVLQIPLEVISGQREAELTFAGALSALPLQGKVCVFDIGGGSTELIIGDTTSGSIAASTSLNVGSVRLTERLKLSDPPSAEQAQLVRDTVKQQLSAFDLGQAQGLPLVGVAGTVTSLLAVHLGMTTYDPARVHGGVIRSDELRALCERLFFMKLEDRLQIPGLAKGRADVIGAGALLCLSIVEAAQANELLVSDRGVRFGLLQELLRTV